MIRKPPVQTDTLFDQTNVTSPSPDLVTVAVSSYNYARFLPECLESIEAQHHSSLDIIVVDDVSPSDDSVAVVHEWLSQHAARFGRALLLKHRRNQGLAQSRNTAFAHARSEYVFVIDSDNAIYPRAVSRLYEVAKGEGFAGAYSQLEIFDAARGLGSADIWRQEWLRRGNYIDAMALVSKSAWTKVGGYSDRQGWEDYDLWCKFIEEGLTAAFVPEILCRYRRHQGSMGDTTTRAQYAEMIIEMTRHHPWLDLRL
ncbi:MAG: glycosyltransferase family 2 protein [Alphaproteobacteria bacterium]|nr:glycosyltransferase family 2 protein [Alphaproteobacteria bacterium]